MRCPPAAATSRTCSPRRPKSADRIDGAMCMSPSFEIWEAVPLAACPPVSPSRRRCPVSGARASEVVPAGDPWGERPPVARFNCIPAGSRAAGVDILHLMLRLSAPTSERWLQRVRPHLNELLIDHAHCEKKAAGTAMNMLFAYVDRVPL